MRYGLLFLVILSFSITSHGISICRDYYPDTDLALGSTFSITGELEWNPEILGMGSNLPKELREVSFILRTKLAFFNQTLGKNDSLLACPVNSYTLLLSDKEFIKAKKYIEKKVPVIVTGTLSSPQSKIEVFGNGVLLNAEIEPWGQQ